MFVSFRFLLRSGLSPGSGKVEAVYAQHTIKLIQRLRGSFYVRKALQISAWRRYNMRRKNQHGTPIDKANMHTWCKDGQSGNWEVDRCKNVLWRRPSWWVIYERYCFQRSSRGIQKFLNSWPSHSLVECHWLHPYRHQQGTYHQEYLAVQWTVEDGPETVILGLHISAFSTIDRVALFYYAPI